MGRRNTLIFLLLLVGCSRSIPVGSEGNSEVFYDHGNLALRDIDTGLKWGTDCPGERSRQQEAIDKAHGIVWSLGLGLGIFPEAVASKVEKVTVVEISQDVIALVWPYLDLKGRGEVVCADAFEWLRTAEGPVDFIYADIWRGNESDMVQQQERMRKLAERFNCEIIFWDK